jgi:hypothetical protein
MFLPTFGIYLTPVTVLLSGRKSFDNLQLKRFLSNLVGLKGNTKSSMEMLARKALTI